VTGLLASWGGAVAGVSWAAFAFFFAVVLVGVSLTLVRLLEATRMIIESVRQETVPLLSEVTTTVRSVNKELERVDGLMESAGRIAQSAERLSAIVEQTVSSPLIKVVAVGAGLSRAYRRLRKDK
jgi:hypothetical protein